MGKRPAQKPARDFTNGTSGVQETAACRRGNSAGGRGSFSGVGAANPGQVFQEIKTVVPPCEEIRRIPGGAVYSGKIHGREAFLIGCRRYPQQPVPLRKVESAIFTLLTTRNAEKSKTKFTDEIRIENVRVADGDTLRSSRQVVAKARNEVLIQLAAAEGLKRFEICLV